MKATRKVEVRDCILDAVEAASCGLLALIPTRDARGRPTMGRLFGKDRDRLADHALGLGVSRPAVIEHAGRATQHVRLNREQAERCLVECEEGATVKVGMADVEDWT